MTKMEKINTVLHTLTVRYIPVIRLTANPINAPRSIFKWLVLIKELVKKLRQNKITDMALINKAVAVARAAPSMPYLGIRR